MASREKANGSSLALWMRFERVMYGLRVWRPRCSVTGHLIAQFPQHACFEFFPSTLTRVAITMTCVWPQEDIFNMFL
jgi:hypothetical protein